MPDQKPDGKPAPIPSAAPSALRRSLASTTQPFPARETSSTRLPILRPSNAPSTAPTLASTMFPRPASAEAPADLQDVFHHLRAWSKQQLGMTYSGELLHIFDDRIRDLCREFACSPALLLAKLRNGEPAVVQRVAEKLSTNYTFFRREPEMFEYLLDHVLPHLPTGNLRFWSAAASSGDEAYSLAMACLEYFGPSAATRIRILGTDISERQVATAERGVYPREQTALLDANRRTRWFSEAERGQLRVGELPRQMCTFRRMNLAQAQWPFTQRFHVIFLRNVLYYFDGGTRQEVLERCYDTAEDGAILITSLTEPVLDLPTRWRPVRAAVFKREARR